MLVPGKTATSAPAPSPGITRPTTVDEAAAQALDKLAQLLKYPDDLTSKLDTLRKKTAADKAAVDAQLKAATQGQLDDCQTGLDNLRTVQTELEASRATLETIYRNGDKSMRMIPNFPRVQKVSTAHRNFLETQRTLVQFQELSDRVDRVRTTLEEHHRDLLGPAPDLLYLHHDLFCLEEFRDNTLIQVKDANDETVNTVRAYFRRLDDVSARFDAYLWDLARHLLDLVMAKRNSVVVRLAKILEFEEKADEEAMAAADEAASMPRSGSQASLTSGTATSRLGTAGRPVRRHREIKSYRSKFFDVLHDSISARFDQLYAPDKEVPDLLAEAHDMVVHDLTFVYDQLVDLFPKKYKLFPFFVLEYHRHVYDLVNKVILDKMETGTILFIMRWCREYYTDMNDKLGVAQELLEPQLLDGQEKVLVDDYLKLVRTKLDEWMKNLLASETREFKERTQQPEMDSQEMYGLSAAVILFNMVNQQIDVVMEASRGQLLLDVVRECKRVLLVYQSHFLQLVNAEYAKFVQDPNKVPGGIVEYTMALANDSLKCTEFVELIIKRLDAQADYTFRATLADELNGAMDGFMKVSKAACAVLIDAAFADIKSAFALLFTAPAWYEGEVMNDVVATLSDYCTDYKQHLQEYLFNKIMTDTMERFLVAWIDALRAKAAKFRVPRCWDIMQSDLQQAIAFFVAIKEQKAKRIEKYFDIMDKLFALTCSSKKMIFLDWYALWKAYNDVPVAVIEDLLAKRDDLDKAAIKEAMDAIRAKVKEDPPPESQKSIFSVMAAAASASGGK
ncbi:SNARE-binding exocyst subunit S6 [Allomyces javanicus]|nr:SNARE-binding exocyst subunit S6 [Allomyces javanicus]